jgi:hypothetical protein
MICKSINKTDPSDRGFGAGWDIWAPTLYRLPERCWVLEDPPRECRKVTPHERDQWFHDHKNYLEWMHIATLPVGEPSPWVYRFQPPPVLFSDQAEERAAAPGAEGLASHQTAREPEAAANKAVDSPINEPEAPPGTDTLDERHSLNTITYLDRRRNAAQRRYLSSLRALATIRKPAAPAVQVNQLNMGAGEINLPAVEREEDGLRPTCQHLPWEARQLGAQGCRNGQTAHQPARVASILLPVAPTAPTTRDASR